MAAVLSAVMTVTGRVVPFDFTDEKTGEVIGLVHLQVPGAVVSADVPAEEAKRMTPGDVWEFVGGCTVRAAKNRIHINELHSARLIEKAQSKGAVFQHAITPDARSAKAG